MKPAVIAAEYVTWKHAITLGQLAGYGSLADGTLRLKIDVPKEYAREALAALADAIGQQVSVARLQEPGSAHGSDPAVAGGERAPDDRADGVLADAPAAGGSPAPRRRWEELSPAQQAGIRCSEPEFAEFLTRREGGVIRNSAVAQAVRIICGIASRAELNTNHKARVLWHQLDAEYQIATGRIAEQRA